MTRKLLFRLLLDLVATGLLLVALAYYWLDNTVHELVGTGLFLLIIVHNVFNRRWYGTISKVRREARGLIYILVNISLLAAVLALLVTSLMISRTVFGFLDLKGGFTARQVHTLAAYWVLIVVSVHIGFRWPVIMNVARNLSGITAPNVVRTLILRLIAVGIVVLGVKSSMDLGLADKLSMQLSIDFWDFNESTAGFFWRVATIVGLYIVLTYYGLQLMRVVKRMRSSSGSA